MNRFILMVAQGFGLGHSPVAPGTVGSIGGLALFLLLIAPGNWWVLGIGSLAGIAVSIWTSGRAETILKQRDPASVVIDEIAAMPLVFIPWVLSYWFDARDLPPPEYFFQENRWIIMLALFGLFRLFDIAKPWPIANSQKLPGGWGVTIDDVLAGIGTAGLSVLALG